MRNLIAVAVLGLASPAFAQTAVQPPADPAPIVAAERAFAADAQTLGTGAAFLKYSADDAIALRPHPVNVHKALKDMHDQALDWWPLWAGVSRGGDLGFTSGPYSLDGQVGGHYFTVWKKQADGGWKWIFDGGAGADARAEPPKAFDEVVAAEADLADRARNDQAAAHLVDLADDARIYVALQPPAKSREEFPEALLGWPKTIEFAPIGGVAADSADLVWTYGSAHWRLGDKPRDGYYVRVWQRRADGWKLVFAEIVPAPPIRR